MNVLKRFFFWRFYRKERLRRYKATPPKILSVVAVPKKKATYEVTLRNQRGTIVRTHTVAPNPCGAYFN